MVVARMDTTSLPIDVKAVLFFRMKNKHKRLMRQIKSELVHIMRAKKVITVDY